LKIDHSTAFKAHIYNVVQSTKDVSLPHGYVLKKLVHMYQWMF